MKKTLLILTSLILAGLLSTLIADTWRTTDAIRQQGREGSLKIEGQYNASRWSVPLPLKKIHVYSAILAPNHKVVVETDQELVSGHQYFIRFLDRETAVAVRAKALRPPVGSVRLQVAGDGKSTVTESTAAMDRMLERAMGDATTGTAPPPANSANASVPFLIGGANDSTIELIWNNSAVGEWLLLLVLALATKATLLSAWFTPWHERRIKADRTDFVHPSLQRIDADAPPVRPEPIVFAPKPEPADTPPENPPSAAEPLLKLPRK